MEEINLYNHDINLLLNELKEFEYVVDYDFSKHRIELMKEGLIEGLLRLPQFLEYDNGEVLERDDKVCVYLSIEAGNAALCLVEGCELIYHTTFSSYMVRKKQGFSQVKYLNKKGKSRAGSRVRLAETEEFFTNINSELTDLLEEFEVDRIALDCALTLWPYFFDEAIGCPIEKSDYRLYKIPLNIPQSNHTQLQKAINKLKAPMLYWKGESEMLNLLGL